MNNLRDIQFFVQDNFACDENYIWYIPYGEHCIVQIDIITGEASIFMDMGLYFKREYSYRKVFCKGNSLYLIPFNGKSIIEVNTVNHDVKEYYMPRLNGMYTQFINGYYSFVEKNNKIYMFGKKQVITEFDLDTKRIEYYTIPKEIASLNNKKELGLYNGTKENDSIMIYDSHDGKMILFYDSLGEFQTNSISCPFSVITELSGTIDNRLFYNEKKKSVFIWNSDDSLDRIFDYDPLFDMNNVLFAIDSKNNIYFMPRTSGKPFRFNKVNRKLEVENDFPCVDYERMILYNPSIQYWSGIRNNDHFIMIHPYTRKLVIINLITDMIITRDIIFDRESMIAYKESRILDTLLSPLIEEENDDLYCLIHAVSKKG